MTCAVQSVFSRLGLRLVLVLVLVLVLGLGLGLGLGHRLLGNGKAGASR